MHTLSKLIVLWPPVDEILAASKKAQEIKLLDKIAREVTHTIRPVTEVVEHKAIKATGVVFKWEVSDTSTHVRLPEKIAKLSKKELKKMAVDKFVWLSQTFVPHLLQFGEWRVYFVGGRFYEIILTEPDPSKVAQSLRVDLPVQPLRSGIGLCQTVG